MVAVGRSIFVFGGCGPEGRRLSDLHEFEVDRNFWTDHGVGPMSGRGGAGLVASSDQKQVRIANFSLGKVWFDLGGRQYGWLC